MFAKRGSMPDRKSLVSTLWLTSLLALVASVVVAPIWTPGFVTVSSRPGSLCRNSALPQGQPTTRLNAPIATDAVPQVKALPSQDEEQDRDDALYEPRIPFLIPCSFRKVPERQLIAPRSFLSLSPLRC
jgi:hypothetical protein